MKRQHLAPDTETTTRFAAQVRARLATAAMPRVVQDVLISVHAKESSQLLHDPMFWVTVTTDICGQAPHALGLEHCGYELAVGFATVEVRAGGGNAQSQRILAGEDRRRKRQHLVLVVVAKPTWCGRLLLAPVAVSGCAGALDGGCWLSRCSWPVFRCCSICNGMRCTTR